jgi:predicted transcriptional regulator
MISNKYLDIAKEVSEIESETNLAKSLNISKQHLYRIRKKKIDISGDLFLKVSELSKIDLVKIMLEIHEERSKEPNAKAAWRKEIDKYGGFTVKKTHADNNYLRVV